MGNSNELIHIEYKDDTPLVSGRDLHAGLGIKTAYKDWMPRMIEYGFVEGKDFCSFLSESTGGRPAIDHTISIDMAKQICMIQRNDAGKKYREYFLEIERKWNSPEAIMARALQVANAQLEQLKSSVSQLESENKVLAEEKLKWADRPFINAVIRKYASGMYGNNFGLAWTDYKKELLYRHGINLNLRITNWLNEHGVKTKPKTLDMLTEDELPKAASTAVALCKAANVDISEYIPKNVHIDTDLGKIA